MQGPSTPRQRPPGHMHEFYSHHSSEPVLAAYYGRRPCGKPPAQSTSASAADAAALLGGGGGTPRRVVEEGVPPPAADAAGGGLSLELVEPAEPKPEPAEPKPELELKEAGQETRERRVSFRNEADDELSRHASTSSMGSDASSSSGSSSALRSSGRQRRPRSNSNGLPAEPDESADLACGTLLAIVFLLRASPTAPRLLSGLVSVLATVVFAAQAMFAWKLVNNASDPDGDDIKVFLLEGYVYLKCAFAGHEPVAGEPAPLAACAVLHDMCTLNATAGAGIETVPCRLGMADAFDEEFTLLKAVGNSTDIEDLPVCLTDEGLGNGAINMVAGMLIVSATVLLGLVEQISGMYALHDTRSLYVVAVLILFHVMLASTLLVASRRRIATVANEFWDVMEASVTVFLVTEIDDLVLYCVKRHPVVHSALVSLRIRRITDPVIRADPLVSPCTAELAIQSAAEIERQRAALRIHWGHSRSLQILRDKAVNARVPADALQRAVEAGRPEAAVSAAICDQYRRRTAVLFQPMEWMRTAVELSPYQYFVEWVCWAATFGLMGSSTVDLVRMTCVDIDRMNWESKLVFNLAMVSNFTGNVLALMCFTIYDVRILFKESSDAAKRAKELDRIAKEQELERVRAEAAAEQAATKIKAHSTASFEVEIVEATAVGKLKGRGRQASTAALGASTAALKSLGRVASAASTAASNSAAAGTVLNLDRGKLGRAVVFYSAIWLYVGVHTSIIYASDLSAASEREVLMPVGGLCLFVGLYLVPRGNWSKWCRMREHDTDQDDGELEMGDDAASSASLRIGTPGPRGSARASVGEEDDDDDEEDWAAGATESGGSGSGLVPSNPDPDLPAGSPPVGRLTVGRRHHGGSMADYEEEEDDLDPADGDLEEGAETAALTTASAPMLFGP